MLALDLILLGFETTKCLACDYNLHMWGSAVLYLTCCIVAYVVPISVAVLAPFTMFDGAKGGIKAMASLFLRSSAIC